MTTIIIQATNGDKLKIAVDALSATTIHIITQTVKGEYIVVYTP